MKILSAYSLEQENISNEELSRISSSIEFLINKWLDDKGAIDANAPEGTFVSQTRNGDGRFSRRNISVRDNILSQVETTEKSKGGQIFSTHIQRKIANDYTVKLNNVYFQLYRDKSQSYVHTKSL